jgi:hypothetical protein
MDEDLRTTFLYEIGVQCTFIVKADEQLQHAQTPSERWYAIQSLVTAAANVSKLAWGYKGKRAGERIAIRQALGLTDGSPLHEVDLRNDFEHADERLEDFSRRAPGSGMLEIRTITTQHGIYPPAAERFHNYNPDTRVVSFWKHSLSVSALAEEARRILSLDWVLILVPDFPPEVPHSRALPF